jgi:DNA polymerase-3 subunit gamma/tau
VQYAPTRSRFKIYLIDEVHMLSTHSFNALLKTLEEPPPHVKFLLATTDPQKLPATVLSRCLQFNLKNMPPEQIVGHLSHVLEQEMVAYEEPALWLLGRAASGSMRDALSLTDQAIAYGSGKVSEGDVRSMLGSVDLGYVYELLEAVSANAPTEALAVVARMAEHAPDFEGSLDELISLIHRVALAQAVPDAVDNSWGDADRVTQLAASITAEDAQLFYQIAINGKRDIGLSPDPRRGFEMILLRMLAFRPAAVIDDTLRPADLQPANAAPAATVLEGSTPAKKHREGPAVVVGKDSKAPDRIRAANSTAPAPAPEPESSVAGVEPERAQPEFALRQLEQANWHDLLARLGLAGIVYNIASHCILQRNDSGQLAFVLDTAHAVLFNEGHADKLRMALENYFGQSVQVAITLGDVDSETPAMRQDRLAQERQAEAVSAIEGDPQLQALITRFDAELDRASIQPTDV